MSDYLDDNDNDGIKGLRKKHKEQAEQLKNQQKLIDQLMAERQTAGVSDHLASRGLDPRVAKFYPKDAKTDKESVDQWVDENRELFGARQMATPDGNPREDTLTDAERRGYQAVADIASYETGLVRTLDSQLSEIKFDPMNPQASQDAVMAKLKEFEGLMNM